MKLKEVDRSQERSLLTGYIVSAELIRQVDQWLDDRYLEASGARTILKWCRNYHNQYSKAPGRDIENIFLTALKDNELDEDEQEYIARLLTSLSGEYDQRTGQFNTEYHIDQAEKFCRRKHLQMVRDEIDGYLAQGRIEDAEAVVRQFIPVAKSTQVWSQPFENHDRIRRAFSTVEESTVFTLPGDLGIFMNAQLYRGAFIGFLAPEKRGKSFILQELGMRAYRQGCNVAFFECGDMSESQRYIRLFQYVTQQPYHRERRPGDMIELEYPIDFDGTAELRSYRNLTGDDAIEGAQKWLRRKRLTSGTKGTFRLSVHSTDTLTARGMRQILEQWKNEDGFVPDVIVDDYIDIHAAENGRHDFRHQDNQKWTSARTLNLDYNCVYITATQADADSYDRESLTMRNFSENKRKFGHVTAMYAINQTKEEKARNVVRLGSIGVVREGREMGQVQLLQCLEIGRPYLDSRFWKKVPKAKHNDSSTEPVLSKTELAHKLLLDGMSPRDINKQHRISFQIITQAKKRVHQSDKLSDTINT